MGNGYVCLVKTIPDNLTTLAYHNDVFGPIASYHGAIPNRPKITDVTKLGCMESAIENRGKLAVG